MIIKARPDILDFTEVDIHQWHQLIAAADFLRSMMGISTDAWNDANRTIGRESSYWSICCGAIGNGAAQYISESCGVTKFMLTEA